MVDCFTLFDFLAEAFGPEYGLALYDLQCMPYALIKKCTGTNGSRKPSLDERDVTKDLGRRIEEYVAQELSYTTEMLTSYAGNGIVRTCTLLLRTGKGEPDKALCIFSAIEINSKGGRTKRAELDDNEFFKLLRGNSPFDIVNKPVKDINDLYIQKEQRVLLGKELASKTNVEAVIAEIITEQSARMKVTPAQMTAAQKMEVVRHLTRADVFQIKGAVAKVASQMSVSMATVYRYLDKLKAATDRDEYGM